MPYLSRATQCQSAPMDEIEPMYTEVEAARLVGIKPRSLRTERHAGRIRHKRVAGRIMYRHSDIVAWQRKDEPCRAEGQIKDLSSSLSKRRVGSKGSGTFVGAKTAAASSVQQAQAIADRLIKSLHTGSLSAGVASRIQGKTAHVI